MIKSQEMVPLEKVGLKKTKTRTSLLALLAKSKKPLSVEVLTNKLSIDKVTVYRTIDVFIQKGLVRKVDTGTREGQYEIVDTKDDHHHVICLECKKVSDFTGCESQTIIKKALLQVKDFSFISHHSFDLFGLCTACAKK